MCLVGERVSVDIIGAFGVPKENHNGRTVFDVYVERILCVGNKYFKRKNLQKYTRVANGEEGIKVMSKIDQVLVERDMGL